MTTELRVTSNSVDYIQKVGSINDIFLCFEKRIRLSKGVKTTFVDKEVFARIWEHALKIDSINVFLKTVRIILYLFCTNIYEIADKKFFGGALILLTSFFINFVFRFVITIISFKHNVFCYAF